MNRDTYYDFVGHCQDLQHQALQLLGERDQLKAQVQHLQHQLDLARQIGGALSPELAKSWLPGLAACDGWDNLSLGNAYDTIWDSAAGKAKGLGLKALVLDLRARPATAADRAAWDADERRRVAKGGGIPARPAPDRVQPLEATSWLLNQRQPGLGDSLTALTKGLRGRLPVVIEASFLLWGDRAVAMLSTDPAQVVKTLRAEVARISGPIGEDFFRFFADMQKAKAIEPQARTVLGVGPDATADEIKQAYRQLARQHHPDVGGDAERFHQIQQAYEALQQPAAVAV
jgi:DnaJ-domain-containing protein 1